MKLATLPIEESAGAILVHNVADAQGHKALAKGHRLTAADIEKLRELGRREIFVARLEADDVRENDAVSRIARAMAGEGVTQTLASGGRVNLLAERRGVLKINTEALMRVNSVEGATVATIPAHSVVQPKKMLATIKTIGLALPDRALQQVESIARELGPAVRVLPLQLTRVAIILSGSAEARTRVEQTYTDALRTRVEELGAEIVSREYAEPNPDAIADALARVVSAGAECVILAGETSIMDVDDVTPLGIRGAGGTIEIYGAPVEPGNLFLLAYCGRVPIIGAPGCVKSRETNVVDLILPRLFAGERVTRADIIELANGGLLI